MSEKNIDYYLALPYTLCLTPVDGGYIVIAEELSGCTSFGKTGDEALRNVREAMKLWMKGSLAHGREIPEPLKGEYSKIDLIVSKSLRSKLLELARKQGLPLRDYITATLWRRAYSEVDQ